jgi:hypothetical protein
MKRKLKLFTQIMEKIFLSEIIVITQHKKKRSKRRKVSEIMKNFGNYEEKSSLKIKEIYKMQ